MTTFPQAVPETSSNVAQGIAPPHSIEAEQSVLGAVLLSEKTHYAYVIEEGLQPDDFYRQRHRIIYESMLDLYSSSTPIDDPTVTEHLRARGKLEEAGGSAESDALPAAGPAVGHRRPGPRRRPARPPRPPPPSGTSAATGRSSRSRRSCAGS